MKTKTTKLRILVFLKTGRVIYNFESQLLKRKTSKIFTRVKNNREALHFNANVGRHHEEFSALGKARRAKEQAATENKEEKASEKLVKQERAQGGCLGTGSRRRT